MTLENITDQIKGKLQFASRLHEKILFDFGEDGKIFLDASQSPPLFASEGSDPDLTLMISMENFAKILSGEQDPNLAFMMGKLKIQGSLGIALKLNSILES
jgi:putative sterol carrier protein